MERGCQWLLGVVQEYPFGVSKRLYHTPAWSEASMYCHYFDLQGQLTLVAQKSSTDASKRHRLRVNVQCLRQVVGASTTWPSSLFPCRGGRAAPSARGVRAKHGWTPRCRHAQRSVLASMDMPGTVTSRGANRCCKVMQQEV